MDFDFDAFYTERNRRLNISDEDIQAYVKRVRTSSARSQELLHFPDNDALQAGMSSGSPPRSPGSQRDIEEMSSFGNVPPPSGDHTRESGSPETPILPRVEYSDTLSSSISPLARAGKRIQARERNSRGCGADLAISPSSPRVQTTSTNMNDILDGAMSGRDVVSNVVETPRRSSSPFLHHGINDRVSLDGDDFSSSLNHIRVEEPIELRKKAQSRQSLRFSSESSLPTSPIEDASSVNLFLKSHNEKPSRAQPDRSRSSEGRRQACKREKLIKMGIKTRAIQMTSGAISRKKSLSDQSIIEELSSDYSSPPPPPPQAAVTPSGTSAAVLAPKGTDLGESNMKKRKRVTEKKDKGKVKPMLPAEYAMALMEKAQSDHYTVVRQKYAQSLIGKNIFYTGGDLRHATERTRSRMDIIVRHGGNLIPKFDVSVVTHIVTDAQKGPTLKALGLKSLDNIPDHIPTVKWSWIVSCIGAAQDDARLNEVWLYAAFSERIDAGIPRLNPTALRNRTKDNITDPVNVSHISQFTQEGNPGKQRNLIDIDIEDISEFPAPDDLQRSHVRASPDGTKKTDPLEQFYAKAKVELESGNPHHSDSDSGSGPDRSGFEFFADVPLVKKGWTCDKSADRIDFCPNQDVIDKLQELMEIHKTRLGEEDRWRAFSYNKCIRILRRYPRRIQSLSEARSLPGVGEKTASKIMEIIETGQLRRIDYENTDDSIKVIRLFQGVYGVGRSIAHQLYAAGCRTLDDLLAGKGGIKLNPAQEIGIKFYDDINSRMPRDEARAIFDLIKPIALQLDPKLYVEIMGSFRRGKADCGDIDILLTRPTDDDKTHAGILSHLLRELHAAGILTEDLALPEDPSELEAVYHGLCHLPKEGSIRRRIDFLTVPWQSRGAALLYYTGDDIFNRAIRMKARVMGYSLNQRGLFAGVVRDPHDRSKKLNPGQLIASETEEEIFRILEVPWQEPQERIRG